MENCDIVDVEKILQIFFFFEKLCVDKNFSKIWKIFLEIYLICRKYFVEKNGVMNHVFRIYFAELIFFNLDLLIINHFFLRIIFSKRKKGIKYR